MQFYRFKISILFYLSKVTVYLYNEYNAVNVFFSEQSKTEKSGMKIPFFRPKQVLYSQESRRNKYCMFLTFVSWVI